MSNLVELDQQIKLQLWDRITNKWKNTPFHNTHLVEMLKVFCHQRPLDQPQYAEAFSEGGYQNCIHDIITWCEDFKNKCSKC